MKNICATLLLSGVAGTAAAHPGEHNVGFVQGLLHQVSSMDHMLMVLGLTAVIGSAIWAVDAVRTALRSGDRADAISPSAAPATKAPQ